MTATYNPKKYGKLLAETLPAIIESEEENERALRIVSRLMKKGEDNLSPEETSLFRLLVKLIEDFEESAYPIGEHSTPLSTLKFLMEQNDLKQSDLLEIFGSKGIASEVINGKRAISKTHAKKLAEKFKVSAELFI
jgi:HTH-type transcriptional regulator / antitoxin HigA